MNVFSELIIISFSKNNVRVNLGSSVVVLCRLLY